MPIRRMPLSTPAALALALLAAGCISGDDGTADAPTETAAAPTEPAALPAPVLAQPAVAAAPAVDEHPLGVGTQLHFSTSMSSSQRAAINAKTGGGVSVGIDNVDLNGDGTNEMVALALARPFCGAGHVCNLWIFQQEGGSWRQINTDSDATKTAYLLPSSTNGYRDLEVTGSCGTDACHYLVAYDGSLYGFADRR